MDSSLPYRLWGHDSLPLPTLLGGPKNNSDLHTLPFRVKLCLSWVVYLAAADKYSRLTPPWNTWGSVVACNGCLPVALRVSVLPTLRAGSIKMKQSRRAAEPLLLLYPCSEGPHSLLALTPLCTGLEERMAKKDKKTKPIPEHMPILHPHAAGIDVGAEEHGVCVPADRAAQPVQKFSAFTCDVHRLAAW
jgi:hypothetical protein